MEEHRACWEHGQSRKGSGDACRQQGQLGTPGGHIHVCPAPWLMQRPALWLPYIPPPQDMPLCLSMCLTAFLGHILGRDTAALILPGQTETTVDRGFPRFYSTRGNTGCAVQVQRQCGGQGFNGWGPRCPVQSDIRRGWHHSTLEEGR